MSSDNDAARQEKAARLEALLSRERADFLRHADRCMGPLLRRRFDPEDVLQEASLVALRSAHTVKGTDDRDFRRHILRAITRATARLGRDHGVKTQKRDLNVEVSWSAIGDIADKVTSITGRIGNREEQARAKRAMARLPKGERKVAELTMEGLDVDEVANTLKRRKTVVYNRYRRVVQKVAEWVKKRGTK